MLTARRLNHFMGLETVMAATELMAAPAVPPLRACLLSGGESRRMGRDKALLAHPSGGTWLEASLQRLALPGVPITLLSRHGLHRSRAQALAPQLGVPLEAMDEPPPWEGPLRALGRLMSLHPDERLLLCPVDMPWLTQAALQVLVGIAAGSPDLIHLAHDGRRLQPLLGIYPSDRPRREALDHVLAGGERRLQAWLEPMGYAAVPLAADVLRNCNRPDDCPGGLPTGGGTPAPG